VQIQCIHELKRDGDFLPTKYGTHNLQNRTYKTMHGLLDLTKLFGGVDDKNKCFGEADINLMDDDSPGVVTVVPMKSTVRGKRETLQFCTLIS
jgi:hypothetical protein